MKKVYKMFDRKTVGQSHIYLDQLPREANGIYNMSFDTNGRLVNVKVIVNITPLH